MFEEETKWGVLLATSYIGDYLRTLLVIIISVLYLPLQLVSKVLRSQEAATAPSAKQSSREEKEPDQEPTVTHIRFSDSDSEDQPQLEP